MRFAQLATAGGRLLSGFLLLLRAFALRGVGAGWLDLGAFWLDLGAFWLDFGALLYVAALLVSRERG